ncbi:MAG: hypothetical protein HYT93_04965 [Parcubacteria group bacterium]|nr:hypothetical protein [Parcubacteria group bacterium]
MDFSGMKRGDKIPRKAKIGLAKVQEIACTPLETLIQGVIVNIGLFVLFCLALGLFSKLNWGTAFASAMLLALYFYYLCLEDVSIGSVGIPTIFEKRNTPWEKVLTEGKHWKFYPFSDIAIVNMKEQTKSLEAFSVNAANSGAGKKKEQDKTATPADTTPDKKDIVRLRVEVSIQFFVWDPWRCLSIENAEEALVNIVKDSMITVSQSYDDTELMQNKDLLIRAAQKAADKESDHLGICVKKILIKKIEPWNPKILDAHERIGIETLRAIGDGIVTSNNINRIKNYSADLGIPVAEAIKLHGNAQGLMPRQEIMVTEVGDAPVNSFIGAAAVLRSEQAKPAQTHEEKKPEGGE